MSEFVKAFFFFFFWVQVTNRKGTQDAEGRAASSLYSLECELCEAINRRLIAGVKTKELYNSVALWETGSRPKKNTCAHANLLELGFKA